MNRFFHFNPWENVEPNVKKNENCLVFSINRISFFATFSSGYDPSKLLLIMKKSWTPINKKKKQNGIMHRYWVWMIMESINWFQFLYSCNMLLQDLVFVHFIIILIAVKSFSASSFPIKIHSIPIMTQKRKETELREKGFRVRNGIWPAFQLLFYLKC